MNKIFLGGIIIIALVLGWFIVNPGDTFDYVVTVDSEMDELESELLALDVAVAAGTLTPEQATEAKVKIITRLDTINNSMSTSNRATLTPAQQAQLSDGLARLKSILLKYQATLTAVDNTAVDSEVRSKLKSKGTSNKKISVAITETIEIVEDVAEEVIEDYDESDTEPEVENAEDTTEDETGEVTENEDTTETEVDSENETTEESEDVAEETSETEEEETATSTDTTISTETEIGIEVTETEEETNN